MFKTVIERGLRADTNHWNGTRNNTLMEILKMEVYS
jgi:hypothetical protein